MIQVGVGDKNGVDTARFKLVMSREGFDSFLLRVHAGIKYDAMAVELNEVRIGANLVLAEE